ncbi:Flp family type IVb pilin [Moritella marina]|uniref:Flp family type IVb pilin n=1 Tax=Moritella marina TaxID=90736 RepID=UPI003703D31F
MNKLSMFIQDFIEDESGLTAVEYAVAGGLVVGALVTAFTDLGGAASDRLDSLTTAIGGTPTVVP